MDEWSCHTDHGCVLLHGGVQRLDGSKCFVDSIAAADGNTISRSWQGKNTKTETEKSNEDCKGLHFED